MNLSPPTNLDFEHLGAAPEFAEFTAILKKLTGVVMALNDPVTGATLRRFEDKEQNPVCRMIRSDAAGLSRCNACDRKFHSRAEKSGKAQLYTCHAGFWDIAVPIFVFGHHVATISSGQLLREQKSDRAFRHLQERISWLNFSNCDLRKAYDGAPYLLREQVTSLMQLLELFARQICESAQHIRDLNAQLERREIRLAREFVEREFRDPALSLSQAASHAGLSPAHFSNVFRRTTGINFVRFIQTRRVTEAKNQLSKTQDSITEVCFACGFNSLTHFNRVFRAFEKLSPSQYRQAHTLG
ncbi:MAG: PocR ligand-binding domain-containing protein [Verrucomicrobiota bacterium]